MSNMVIEKAQSFLKNFIIKNKVALHCFLCPFRWVWIFMRGTYIKITLQGAVMANDLGSPVLRVHRDGNRVHPVTFEWPFQLLSDAFN